MDDITRTPHYRDLLGAIPAENYVGEDVLAMEIERIFKPSWLCVGALADLANHQDFVTARVGPHSIVVQNFKGELKAFRNVCSHRFSRLQTEPCGNRRLQCPYHGWLYDAAGVPIGIPQNDSAFGLSEAEKATLSLQAYDLALAGHFVFVRMAGDGPDLRDYLGEVYDFLVHVSQICPQRVEEARVDLACNWKLAVENGVEAYHHALVHPETFTHVLQQDIVMNAYGPHCTHEGDLTEKSRHWWSVVADKARLKPSALYRDYISFLIFPNIVTTFTYGALFTFQVIVPTSAVTTHIAASAWLAEGGGAALRPVIASLNGFAEKVRAEDRAICAIAQQGVAERGLGRAAVLGEVDNRVRHFQNAYARRLGEVRHA